ncbi:MAG: DUF503 domain-containing protein [Candidatus Aminicenantes bacterium]|nr:DUF503 domain-containing protein [Candidatus Aminicenantes bacterium]MDH5714798.1 DUF503 domain-containing protein [Candidatus Aminicenantes bacterium]
MVVGLCVVELLLPGSRSLKDKRLLIKGIKDRLRARFNLSLAEVDFQNLWQRAKIGMVSIASSKDVLHTTINKAIEIIESNTQCEIIDCHVEYLI